MTAVGRTVFEATGSTSSRSHHRSPAQRHWPETRPDSGEARRWTAGKRRGIAGMSGSPVYIDGRLVGAVSYSLGEFSKEPIAGITPIAEMLADATLTAPRRPWPRVEVAGTLTPESFQASLRQAFSWARPFAQSPNDVQVLGDVSAGLGTLLRPIATPLTLGGFDPSVVAPVTSVFHEQGFVPMLAGAAQSSASTRGAAPPRLRPGDPIGVALMSGDLEIDHRNGTRSREIASMDSGSLLRSGPTSSATRAYVHACFKPAVPQRLPAPAR